MLSRAAMQTTGRQTPTALFPCFERLDELEEDEDMEDVGVGVTPLSPPPPSIAPLRDGKPVVVVEDLEEV